MTTFTQWLGEHENDETGIGEIARWWRDSAAQRPRVHTPSGVQKYHDKIIRAGELPGTAETDPEFMQVRGRWRETFADVVRAYQHRDDMPGMAGSPEATAVLSRLARIEATTELNRRRIERLMAHFGLVTDPAELGNAAALAVRSRLGGQGAAAEPAAERDQRAVSMLNAPGSVWHDPYVYNAALRATGRDHFESPADTPEMIEIAGWGELFRTADHVSAAQSEAAA